MQGNRVRGVREEYGMRGLKYDEEQKKNMRMWETKEQNEDKGITWRYEYEKIDTNGLEKRERRRW